MRHRPASNSAQQRHSTRRDTGHTCFLSPWSRRYSGGGGQHSDKRREKEAILGRHQFDPASKMQVAVDTGGSDGQEVFSLFSTNLASTGLTCCPPTSSLKQSHSYHRPGATLNNYERRDNLVHFDSNTGCQKLIAD